MKSRPQVIVDQIRFINSYLEQHKVKDQSDLVFTIYQTWLLSSRYYHGFNFYVHSTLCGNPCLVLAGSTNPEEFDCLQFI